MQLALCNRLNDASSIDCRRFNLREVLLYSMHPEQLFKPGHLGKSPCVAHPSRVFCTSGSFTRYLEYD